MQYQFVTSEAALAQLVSDCCSKPAVAMDTEFARFKTYYPVVGLIQIYDGEACYLVDPLEVKDISALATLMTDTSTIKVFHACSEDLEVFQDCLGVLPTPIFDTQIAAAILDTGFSVSYQNLVEKWLNIKIPKEETRSDWLQRPLSDSQLEYAALDVIHLLEVYEKQVAALETSGRAGWVEEECRDLPSDIPTQIDPELYYKKVKGLWRLNQRQLHLLKALCAWRERLARELNLPRNRVVDEKILYEISRQQDFSIDTLRHQVGMPGKLANRYGPDIQKMAEASIQASESELPEPVARNNIPINAKLLKSLKKTVETKAEQLKVAPEMLAKRRHLEQLLRSLEVTGRYQLPNALKGWRESVIGDELLQSLLRSS